MSSLTLCLQSNNPNFYLKLAKLLYENHEIDEAINAVNYAIQLNSKFIPAIVFLAEIYESQKKFDQVIYCYQQIASFQPENSVAQAKIAGAMMRCGNLLGAIEFYKQATALPNPPIWAYLGLAQCLEKNNDLDQAITAYEQLVYLEPTNAKSYLQLARIYSKLCVKNNSFLVQVIQNYQKVIALSSETNVSIYDEIIAFLKMHNRQREIVKIFPKVAHLLLRLWSALNQHDLESFVFPEQDTNHIRKIGLPLISLFFESTSQYKTIYLNNIDQGDEETLTKLGLSPQYLIQNVSETHYEEDSTRYTSLQNHTYLPSPVKNLLEKTAFQSEAIECGYIQVFCPITGEVLHSNRSFFIDNSIGGTICYRFLGKEVFYLFLGKPEDGFAKECFYFPNHDLIVVLAESLYKPNKFNDFKSYMVNAYRKVKQYLDSSEPPQKAVIIQVSHFAHHLWNELSAIESFYSRSDQLHHRVDKFLVLAEPLGPLEGIFPEIPTEQIQRISSDRIFELVLENNYFVTRLGFNFIQATLADRLQNMALHQCSDQFLRRARTFRNWHFPLIWISLRLQDRAWVSIAEGVVNIAQELATTFPNLGIVIDGISLPFGRSNLTYLKGLAEREKKVVNEISAALPPNIGVFNAVGCMMYESIFLANLVDVYIAHHGSLQHKVGWFATKPGITHANHLLSQIDIVNHQSVWGRENAIAPIKLDKQFIYPSEASNRTGRSEDYECEWTAIYAEIKKICLSLSN